MEKSTVIEILRTFSKEELAGFGDFVESPYHNKKSNVVKLYKALRKHSPEFPPEKITKEKMWGAVFPGKAYNYGIIKNHIFDLSILAQKFLELENQKTKPIERDINLLQQYKLRALKSLFSKSIRETKKKFSASLIDNSTFYYGYMLEYTEISFIDYEFLLKSKKTDYYSELNRNLSLFYITNQLYHNHNNIQLAFNKHANVDMNLHEKALKTYEETPFKSNYTDILYYAYKAACNLEDTNSYEMVKKLFFENHTSFTRSIQYDIAVCLLNFCRNNASKGNKKFIADEFQYIKLMVEDNLYQNTGFGWMDQYLYMNSVMCACRAGEYDWAEKFIEEKNYELTESIREQYKNYAYTTLNLRRGRFEEALKYLAKCNNVDDGDKLNIRVFEFNAYYELGYYDELKALADTTMHFLRKDKIFSVAEHNAFRNYISAITKLMDYKFNIGDKQKDEGFLRSVLDFINNNKTLNSKWLAQKIDELKTK